MVVATLTMVAAACGQSEPDRSPLPEIPETTEPPPPVIVDPIPNDGSCVLVVGEGARVVSINEDFDASDTFVVGDIITAVGGRAVTTDQLLIAELGNHRPGEVITFDYQRDGEARQDDVTLGANPADDQRAMLGVNVDSAISGHAPVNTPQGELTPGRTHLLSVDGSLYLHDPVAAAWQSVGVDGPFGSVVALDGRLVTADSSGLGLAPLESSELIALPTSGRLIINLLGVMDGLLVASLAEVSTDGTEVTSAAVAGIDVAANELVWEWNPGTVDGQVVSPILGATAPDGGVAAITSLVDGNRLHSLLDAAGNVVAGWGTETAFLPARTIVVGWYDQSELAFLAGSGTEVSLNLLDLADLSTTQLRLLDLSEPLLQVWAVGDGTSVVLTDGVESQVFDIDAQAPGRVVARACDVTEVAGPVALQSWLPT